jgi:hypothetical protein
MPDASYRNNSDKSSQRAPVIFLAEDRKLPSKGTYRDSGYDKQTNKQTAHTALIQQRVDQ